MKKFIPAFAATAMILTLSAAASVSAGAITAFSIDDAAAAAFTKAGVNEADAVVYKKAWEYDNGAEKYEIKFFIPGQTKFDCDVDVVSCEVIKCESEPWDAEDEFEYGALTPNANADKKAEEAGLEKAAQTAFADAGVTEDQVVVYKRGTDFEMEKLYIPSTSSSRKKPNSIMISIRRPEPFSPKSRMPGKLKITLNS